MTEGNRPWPLPALAVARRPRSGEILAAIAFLAVSAPVMANMLPFWLGMAAVLGVAALAASVLAHRAGRPVLGANWPDTLLGLGLALASWGAVRLLLPLAVEVIPSLADGFVFIGGYAAGQPLALAYAGFVAIAVGEELVWRWYLPWRLQSWLGIHALPALLVSTIGYCALHAFTGRYYLLPAAFLFGMLWGTLSAWRGSPWAAIVWHVTFDFAIFLWAPPVLPA